MGQVVGNYDRQRCHSLESDSDGSALGGGCTTVDDGDSTYSKGSRRDPFYSEVRALISRGF